MNEMKAWADLLERYGRHGDTMLAHISTKEADLLERRRGGKGPSINPVTGKREFWGGDDSDSVGGFGDNGSLGGGGYSESSIGGPGGDGSNQADRSDGFGGGPNGGVGGRTSFSDFANDMSMRAGAPESEISERAGGVNWNDYQMQGYAKAGTFSRLGEEIVSPSMKASRWGAPTAQAPGILGPMMGVLAGPAFGLAMGLGAAMGRAQTPAEQAASMAEMSERGAMNSTGAERNWYDPQYGADAGVSAPAAQPSPPTVQEMKPPRLTPESWDEEGFLTRNPEVKAAVSNGTWTSGYDFDQAYKTHAGVPYEAAMTVSRPEKYVDELLSTRAGQIMPYRGY